MSPPPPPRHTTSLSDLAPEIARHGADEDKHGRVFDRPRRKRGPHPVPVPPETDYPMLLERSGVGPAHDRLRRDEPLTEHDVVVHLAHSRVTEQRAAAQTGLPVRDFGDHPEIGGAVRTTSADEDDHLAYCHEEPLRLARAGHGRAIRSTPRGCALVESAVHRDVSLAVMDYVDRILRWPRAKSAVLAAGVPVRYAYG
ncbi:ferritin-like domain-containing protein, partial [Streptomyces sp. Act-28]